MLSTYRLCYVLDLRASSSRCPRSSVEAFEARHDGDGSRNAMRRLDRTAAMRSIGMHRATG
jgi:hypothetical protein